ncbi:hypothetical protein WICPIJ_009254 [Wickerhamomyces pijperi]|uniref:Oxidoreductase n=1 Tax=Wickerhamomyces pijperi TaxID=599730 RepID=A0A9P8TEV3_WICPI|nr:hypothetical protein WICPIJ_009254 [Wickerhamomyces pijperi]
MSIESKKPLNLSVIIFGGTSGLGQAISRHLASLGCQITVVGRSFKDQDLQENIKFKEADLTSLEYTKNLASELSANISKYDLIVFTTGIFASSSREETKEGIERDMAVSYLNRYVLLRNFLPVLSSSSTESKSANKLGFTRRVVLFGYPGNGQLGTIEDLNQEKSYSFMKAHMNTVAGNEALVKYIRLKYPEVEAVGVNPGLVKTDIRKNLTGTGIFSRMLEGVLGAFNPTPEQFAANITPSLLQPSLGDTEFINSKGKSIPGSNKFDNDYAMKYIRVSESLIEQKLGADFFTA